MNETSLTSSSLSSFLSKWSAIRHPSPTSTLAERLTSFLPEYRACVTPATRQVDKETGASGNQLQLRQLQATLEALHGPLRSAQSAGKFLNVWSMARLRRDELRNAAAFASLIDPQICPVTGAAFLSALLDRASGTGINVLPDEPSLRAGYVVVTEDYPLGYADCRVDISLEGLDFLLVIEVKIDAAEGVAQLQRYDDVIRAKAKLLNKRPALVYLSPRPSLKPPADSVYLGWSDVVVAARRVGRQYQSGDNALFSTLLLHFAAHAEQFA